MGKFELPTLTSTLESIWRQKIPNAPIILANLILISLACYRLIKSDEISKDEGRKLSYADITLSFIGSFVVILLCLVFIFALLFGSGNNGFIKTIVIILVLLGILVLNPFTITMLRVGLDTKLNDQQKNILSGITIPSSLLSIYLTANIWNGYFLD